MQGVKNAISYSQDFQYDAAKVLALGINPYDESLNPTGVLNELGYEEYFKQMEANQFPSLLFLLLPYTLFSPMQARILWIISNLIFTSLIIFLLRRTLFKKWSGLDFALISAMMIAGTPYRNQLGVGQHTLFSLAFFMLAVYFSEEKKNDIAAGIALCVSYFKYTLTVPLALYFVYKRRWKMLVISVLPHIVLTFVASIYLNDSFFNMLIKPLKVSSALTSEGSMDIGSYLGGGSLTMLLTVMLLGLLLVLAFMLRPNCDSSLIAILTMWSMIITYHRSYDYFVIILPFCMYEGIKFSKSKTDNVAYLLLWLSTVGVFFVSRILNNTGDTPYLVAIIYYICTIYITGVKGLKNLKNER